MNILTKETIKKFDKKNVWFFRFKKLDKKTMLITNDIWAYSYLTFDEFKYFLLWWKDLTIKKKKELENKKFFKNTSYYESDYKYEYWTKNSFLAFGPILHIMIITLRCNHKCKYCHAAAAPMSAKKYDMTKELAQKTIDVMFFSTARSITIEFQWGEPLVNWNVIKFSIEYAYKKSKAIWKKVNFCLVTNLTLMTDKILDFLLKNKVSISTSLDWNEEVHNYNRTYKWWNSYAEVIKWIKKINIRYKKEEKIHWFLGYQRTMWALLTTTKKTLWKWKEVIDSYVDIWMDWIFIRPLSPYWFASSELEKLWYSAEDFLIFYKKSLDYIIELNKKGILLREHFASIYLWKIFKPKDPNYLDDRSPCWASIGQVAYNFDWKIYSCDEGRMLWRMWLDEFKIWKVTDNPKESYIDMITSDSTKILVESSTLDWLPWFEGDVYKTYIWTCPIHNYKSRNTVYPNFSIDYKKKIEHWILDYLFLKIRNKETKFIFKKWIREPEIAKGKCDC